MDKRLTKLDMHREFAKVWAEFGDRRGETPPAEANPRAEPDFKPQVECLQTHVRGLEAAVREGFAELTELISQRQA